MPLGAPNTPLHTGWWCLQHHRSCRAQGRGVHTHRDAHSGYQTENLMAFYISSFEYNKFIKP